MKFIFPRNYSFHSKFLGFIDYSTLFLNVLWLTFLIAISNLLLENLDIKIFLCVTLYLPVLIFSVVGFHNENIIYVFFYLKNFIKNRRVYFYNKAN